MQAPPPGARDRGRLRRGELWQNCEDYTNYGRRERGRKELCFTDAASVIIFPLRRRDNEGQQVPVLTSHQRVESIIMDSVESIIMDTEREIIVGVDDT